MEVQCIGRIKSSFSEPANPEEMHKAISVIVVNEEYEDGLYRIEESYDAHSPVFRRGLASSLRRHYSSKQY
jgi:tRNA (Thr-GGU) A37 N-methylase